MSFAPQRTSSAPFGAAPFSAGAAPGGNYRQAYGNPSIAHNADGKTRQAPAALPMPTPGVGQPFKAKQASPATSTPPPQAQSPPLPPSVTSPATSAAIPTPLPDGATGSTGKAITLQDLDPVWAEAMRTATDEAGSDVMAWAKSVWENHRDELSTQEKPRHLFERREEGIFGGQPVATAKRHILVKDRTIPHQVMGILSRVTPDNYEHIQQELLNLPIRQSEDAEITEVVNVFFKKAIRPEDSIYAPEYARLIGALVRHIEEKEREKEGGRGVAKVIRSAVVNKCKEQYENLPILRELQEAAACPDNQEAEVRRRDLVAKLKANINFLGQLFVNKLIREHVVDLVLYSLLWTKEGLNTNMQDYELEQFFTLLEVCAPKLSTEFKDKYQDHWIKTLDELASMSTVSKRTHVIAMNCKDYIENQYVKRGRQRGPMKLDDYNRITAEQQVRDFEMVNRSIRQQQQQAAQQQQQQQQQTPLHQGPGRQGSALRGKLPVTSPNGASPSYSAVAGNRGQQQQQQQAAPVQEMTFNDFMKALNTIIDEVLATTPDGKVPTMPDTKNPIPAEAKTLDPKTLVSFLVEWAYKLISSNRWARNRMLVGGILRNACAAGAITRAQITEFTKQIAVRCVQEQSDVPKVFTFFCEVVESSPDLLGYAAYNALIREACTFHPTVSFNLLKTAARAVHESSERLSESAGANNKVATPVVATPIAAGSDFTTVAATRVHLLPHLLRFTGYTFADPKAKPASSGAESEECDDDDDVLVREREDYDVIDIIRAEVDEYCICVYASLMNCCSLNEDGVDMPTGKTPVERIKAILPDGDTRNDQFKNPNVSRRVLSAIFCFARFNRKLMEALMGVALKPIFDSLKTTSQITALLMDVYETWLELDRRPGAALDWCLEQIFANGPSSLPNSSSAETLFGEIRKNGDHVHIPATLAKVGRK